MSTNSITNPRAADALLADQPVSRWAALPIVLSGTFMVVLDFFIVNVTLPSIQSHLHASGGDLEWIVAGYALTSAVFLITGGRLGDRIGRRRAFCAGLALFTLSSAVCGLAGDPTMLVLARLAQGVGGALLLPNVLAIIGVTYEGPDRVKALSAYGLVMGLAAIGGQLIGGALVQANLGGLAWRACFMINVPVGAIALLAAPAFVQESRAASKPDLDLTGTSLVTAGLVAIVLPLVDGRAHGWPTWTWISLACAPVIFAALAAQQRRLHRAGGMPLIDPALFAKRSFSAGLLTQLVFWCGQASSFLVLALYLQQGRGLSPLHAGLVFTILAVAYVAASFGAPSLAMRHGRGVLTLAALTLASGHAILLGTVAAVGVGGSVAVLAPGLALIGIGMGLAIAPLTTIILSQISPAQAGSASGALAAMQGVGGAIGVSVIGVIFFGALHSGIATAFELSLGTLAVIVIGVGLLTRLLPARADS